MQHHWMTGCPEIHRILLHFSKRIFFETVMAELAQVDGRISKPSALVPCYQPGFPQLAACKRGVRHSHGELLGDVRHR